MRVELAMIVAVMLFLYLALNQERSITYTCPQCGSRNGDHGKDCSWGTL